MTTTKIAINNTRQSKEKGSKKLLFLCWTTIFEIKQTETAVHCQTSAIMQSPSLPYSYSPPMLLKSYHDLKNKEEQIMMAEERISSTAANAPSSAKGTFAVAAIQITAAGLPNNDTEGFWSIAQNAVHDAAVAGANLILLPELFLGPYFCQSQEAELMSLAEPISEDHFVLKRMMQLAKQHGVVLPISLYERKNNALYNSIAMIDADGSLLGTYRKCIIVQGEIIFLALKWLIVFVDFSR
jgi:hypothetical protein